VRLRTVLRLVITRTLWFQTTDRVPWTIRRRSRRHLSHRRQLYRWALGALRTAHLVHIVCSKVVPFTRTLNLRPDSTRQLQHHQTITDTEAAEAAAVVAAVAAAVETQTRRIPTTTHSHITTQHHTSTTLLVAANTRKPNTWRTSNPLSRIPHPHPRRTTTTGTILTVTCTWVVINRTVTSGNRSTR